MNADAIFRYAEAVCTINGRLEPECLAAYYRGVIKSLLDEPSAIEALFDAIESYPHWTQRSQQ